MSDVDKTINDDTVGEREESDENWSDEESDVREIVLGLPAMSISSRIFDEEVEEARLNEQAVIAAELVMAAVEEAVMKGMSEDGGRSGKKKSRVRKKSENDDEASGSGSKKPRRRSSELTNVPQGPPVCHICGKGFRSWKAVFGHMRSHKDRNYQGFLPPPIFSAVAERFTIPGPNSAFVPVTATGGSSSGGSLRSLQIDLNVNPVEEVEQVHESEPIVKFDLNKLPEDEEEEDRAK